MKVEVLGDFAKLAEPVRLDARTVIIRDAYDQPILVAQTLDNGQIFVSRAGSPDFKDTLKSLGIDVKVQFREVKVS
jgi:hypothetical protein